MQHAFVDALKTSDIEAVKKCLNDKAVSESLNKVTEDGETALISAIRAGSADIVEVLLHAKADPNLRNKTLDTPLFVACATSDCLFPIPRLLIAHKAQVNDACDDGSALPLVSALQSKNKGLAQFLLDSNASVNPPTSEPDVVLAAAVKTGDLSLVELVINQYPLAATTIDARVIDAAYRVRKNTGSMHMLEYFSSGAGNVFQVENKATLDSTLYSAVNACDATAVQCLLDMGAQAYDKDDDIPILHEAVLMDWAEGVRMLIAHGADVNQPVILTWGESFLGLAAEYACLDISKVLLEAQADPNVVLERMPLHTAVENDNWPLVELLLQHGADPDIRSLLWFVPFGNVPYGDKTAKELVVLGKTDERIVNALFAK